MTGAFSALCVSAAMASPVEGETFGEPVVYAPAAVTSDPPVDLEADNLVHDADSQTVTAKGYVDLVQDGHARSRVRGMSPL